MDKKTVVIIAAACIVLLLVLVTFFAKPEVKSGTLSPDILYLTTPVTSFTGTVEKVEGDTVTVSQMMASSPNAPANTRIAYRVQVTANTLFGRTYSMNAIVPDAGSTTGGTTSSPPLTVKDLRPGETVTVATSEDLRTNTSGLFTASSIQLSRTSDLNGTIISRQGNVLTVKGTPPRPLSSINAVSATATEKVYQVTVTGSTAMSQVFLGTPPGAGSTEMLQSATVSLDDLRPEMEVYIVTNQDVNIDQDLTALQIRITKTLSSPSPETGKEAGSAE